MTLAYALPVLGAAIFLGEPWRAPERWAAIVLVLLVAVVGRSRRAGRAPPRVRLAPRGVGAAAGGRRRAGRPAADRGRSPPPRPGDRLGPGRRPQHRAAGRFGGHGAPRRHPGVRAAERPRLVGLVRPRRRLQHGQRLGGGTGGDLARRPARPAAARRPARQRTRQHPAAVVAASGVVAGALAAWLALRGGTTRRFDTSTLLGGLAGVVSALAFTGLAWTTSGDLGTVRLTGLGPRLLPLLVMSTTTLGLAGMVTGAVTGVVRHLRRPTTTPRTVATAPTPTTSSGPRSSTRPRRPRRSLGSPRRSAR